MALKWEDRLSMGIAAIDEDHRKLFALVGELRDLAARSAHPDEIDYVLERLVEFAGYHFRREEALLEGNGFPGYAGHKANHDRFAGQAAAILADWRAGRRDGIGPDTADTVARWLVAHIDEDDRAYKAFLTERFSPLPPLSPRSLVTLHLLPALAAVAALALGLVTGAPWLQAAGAAAAVLLAAWIGTNTARTVAAMTDALKQLADDNLEITVPGGRRRDQLGRMAAAVELVKLTLWEVRRNSSEAETIGRRTAIARRQAMDEVGADFRATLQGLLPKVAATVRLVGGRSEAVRADVGDTRRRCDEAAANSDRVAASVDVVSAAAADLSRSIAEVRDRVEDATAIAGRARTAAESAAGTISGLTEATGRIGEIVGLIQAIASQTNLLALNATIEAARAGEAGKGFAVVAGEVKSLANQTASAIGEIGQVVASIQAAAREAVADIGGIGEVIATMDSISQGVAAAMTRQDAATGDIADRVRQAAGGTADVAGRLKEVAAAATSASTASEEVATASTDLAALSAEFETAVDGFLHRLAAAG